MLSPEWRMSEIVQRNSDLEKQVRRLQGAGAEGERATKERNIFARSSRLPNLRLTRRHE